MNTEPFASPDSGHKAALSGEQYIRPEEYP
jgi:hypothetical protein